jgi:hypothetical protein
MVCQFGAMIPHRLNSDGSYDSICRSCHVTVASANLESALAQHEQGHVCDPSRMYQLSEDAFASR